MLSGPWVSTFTLMLIKYILSKRKKYLKDYSTFFQAGKAHFTGLTTIKAFSSLVKLRSDAGADEINDPESFQWGKTRVSKLINLDILNGFVSVATFLCD